jgi:hypothetical protein
MGFIKSDMSFGGTRLSLGWSGKEVRYQNKCTSLCARCQAVGTLNFEGRTSRGRPHTTSRPGWYKRPLLNNTKLVFGIIGSKQPHRE